MTKTISGVKVTIKTVWGGYTATFTIDGKKQSIHKATIHWLTDAVESKIRQAELVKQQYE